MQDFSTVHCSIVRNCSLFKIAEQYCSKCSISCHSIAQNWSQLKSVAYYFEELTTVYSALYYCAVL